MTRLLLIRHGPVDAGARLYGWLDVPLSTSGLEAVEALTSRRQCVPDAVYTSPLKRACAVAERLGLLWNRAPIACASLKEIHCGALEGLPLAEFAHRYPALLARNNTQADDDFAWPGGESYRQFRARVVGSLTRIARAHAGDRVAVVTHCGVISQVMGTLQGRSAARWSDDRPDPLSGTEVVWSASGPQRVLTYNDFDWC
jgi:broad specificity phosphatase PhoE